MAATVGAVTVMLLASVPLLAMRLDANRLQPRALGLRCLEKSLLTCSEVCWDNTDQWRRYPVAPNMVTIRKKRLQLEIFEISFKGPLLGSSHPDILDKIKVGRIGIDRNQNGLFITDA